MPSLIEKHRLKRLQNKNIYDRMCLNVYLSQNLSSEELKLNFCELQTKMKYQPCCPCHKGNLPVSIDSMDNTPPVEGTKCDKPYRHLMRMIRLAYILKQNTETYKRISR